MAGNDATAIGTFPLFNFFLEELRYAVLIDVF
jgi:hypothetical protein